MSVSAQAVNDEVFNYRIASRGKTLFCLCTGRNGLYQFDGLFVSERARWLSKDARRHETQAVRASRLVSSSPFRQ